MIDLLVQALRQKILSAVVFYDEESILPVAESFLNGGLNVMEIPLRTSVSIHAINKIRKEVPEMFVGAGTILNINSLKDSINAGAQFGLSSSLNSKVCNEANQVEFPFIPGVMTPSEIEYAYELGFTIQKLFPAAQLGGASFLKAMLGPYEQLNLQFIPMGGVNLSNINDYLRLKNVIAVGGTWLATKDMMIKKEYKVIETTVREALQYMRDE